MVIRYPDDVMEANVDAKTQRAGPEWLWRAARETTASAKDIRYTPRQKINDATGLFELRDAEKTQVNGVKEGL